MDSKEKQIAKQKLGLTLQKVLAENKKVKDANSIDSLRKLAASSGIEYSIIQKISSGQRDPQFTTLLSIAEGIGMPISEFLFLYESSQIPSQIKKNSLLNKKKK